MVNKFFTALSFTSFLVQKDLKFQKSCNIQGNTNSERFLLDLFVNIKPDCSC